MNEGYFALAAYARTFREQVALGNLAPALGDVALRAEATKEDPLAFARILGSATFDMLCAEVGTAVLKDIGSASGARRTAGQHAIYICTETLSSGGHTRVVSDLIRAAPEYIHHVVLTNLWERPEHFNFKQEFEALGARITILPQGSLLDKLRGLTKYLDSFERARVFLLNHHQDSVAVAAVGASARHERFFIHHSDYLFCLGLFLPGVVHVDLHTMGFHDCRNTLKIDANVYWPLTCDRGDTTRSDPFLGDGLVTCCCGMEHKFTGRYPVDYFDTVAAILKARAGKHIHIGSIEEQRKRRLLDTLAAGGVATDRFQHIAHVPNLRTALLDLKVDAYLVSFPIGGGRASIEAMAAGIPVIGHLHHYNNVLGGTDLLPNTAPVWSNVQELLAILQTLNQDTLVALAAASRERYETFHHPRLLARALLGESLEPPPRRAPAIEPVQRYLFEKYYLAATSQKPFTVPAASWRQ